MIMWRVGRVGRTPAESIIPTKANLEGFKTMLGVSGRTNDIVTGPTETPVPVICTTKINYNGPLTDESLSLLANFINKLESLEVVVTFC